MILSMPDPHPGRCINLRPQTDANGYPITVRCLEYEHERHVCRFPPEPKRNTSHAHSINTVTQPQPWKRPE